MARRMLLIFVWAVMFFFGSAILLYLVWRLYFALTGAPRQRPNEQTFFWLGLSYAVVPMALGILGTVLGIRGLLPGTRKTNT
jgi:hypothetical protein